jgi:hypothetical protein
MVKLVFTFKVLKEKQGEFSEFVKSGTKPDNEVGDADHNYHNWPPPHKFFLFLAIANQVSF